MKLQTPLWIKIFYTLVDHSGEHLISKSGGRLPKVKGYMGHVEKGTSPLVMVVVKDGDIFAEPGAMKQAQGRMKKQGMSGRKKKKSWTEQRGGIEVLG